MKPLKFHHLLVLILVLVFTLREFSPVSAQVSYALLIKLSVIQASPGARIEITGSHFKPDELVAFVLFQGEESTQLGTFFADDHGDFETSVLLPYELPLGEYEFRGVTETGDYAAVPLFIVPDPNLETGESLREEEDPLLAPMPTYAPGVSVTPMASVKTSETSTTASSAFPWMPVLIVMSILAVLLFVRLGGRRRGAR